MLGFPSDRADKALRPNIILIMTDDMGFLTSVVMAVRFRRPDRLAEHGLRYTRFTTPPAVAPRASLMTGLYAHQAGMGAMTQPLRCAVIRSASTELCDHC